MSMACVALNSQQGFSIEQIFGIFDKLHCRFKRYQMIHCDVTVQAFHFKWPTELVIILLVDFLYDPFSDM